MQSELVAHFFISLFDRTLQSQINFCVAEHYDDHTWCSSITAGDERMYPVVWRSSRGNDRCSLRPPTSSTFHNGGPRGTSLAKVFATRVHPTPCREPAVQNLCPRLRAISTGRVGLCDMTTSRLTLSILGGSIAGGFAYARAWKSWRDRNFLTRVNVSLNSLPRGRLIIRTLDEYHLGDIFHNAKLANIVLAAAKKTNANEPFLRFDDGDSWFVLTTIMVRTYFMQLTSTDL